MLTFRVEFAGLWKLRRDQLDRDLITIESNIQKYLAPFLSNPHQQLPKKLQEIHMDLRINAQSPVDDGDLSDVYLLEEVGCICPSITTVITDTMQSSSLSTVPKFTSSIIFGNIPCPLRERRLGVEKRLRESLKPLISTSGGEPIGRINVEWRDNLHCLGDPFIMP
jgi:hypothetical protein